MPNIDSIQPVYYDSLDPYNVHFDNLPLRNIVERQEAINRTVEAQWQYFMGASGTSGSLTNRLNQSLNDDGTLSVGAIDLAMHNIANHTDGAYDYGTSIISYVRMTTNERAKLSLIGDESNNITINVETPSVIVPFESGAITFVQSDAITWAVTSSNEISANLTFAVAALHRHYCDQTPVHTTPMDPDYQNYSVYYGATEFVDGSLSVYINGIRISSDSSAYIYVPDTSTEGGDWIFTYFTPSPTTGAFVLNRAIATTDVIKIDYNLSID